MTDEDIIAYLLAELPEEDLERFEDECFAPESWPTQIELAEEELIDAYLRHELVPERRHRFEQNYLATEARQERVSIAAALLHCVDKYNAADEEVVVVTTRTLTWAEGFRAFWSSHIWTVRTVTTVAVVAIVAGALWLLIPRATSPRTFATLTLTISNSNRAEGAQAGTVKLPPNAEGLNVSLILPQPSPPAAPYRVELENDNGETKSVEVVAKDAQSVSVVIPVGQLPRGQYALKLFAFKPDGTEQRISGTYFFIVE